MGLSIQPGGIHLQGGAQVDVAVLGIGHLGGGPRVEAKVTAAVSADAFTGSVQGQGQGLVEWHLTEDAPKATKPAWSTVFQLTVPFTFHEVQTPTWSVGISGHSRTAGRERGTVTKTDARRQEVHHGGS